jgi:hypothetical protein
MPRPVPLSTIEKAWRAHPLGRDRGAGGRRSLTGFSFQLALSLDQLLTAAFSGSPPTELLFDSLGDLTRLADGTAYLIQVKSTLTAERAREVAREALDVDAFLAEQFPDLRDRFRFSVWCRRREGRLEPREIMAAMLGLSGSETERWQQLRERIQPIEIRPDPYLMIVLRLFPHAEAPLALTHALLGTLLRLLGEDMPSDRIALELLRLIQDQRRRIESELASPGRLLVPEDFVPGVSETTHVLVGDRPRLEDLVDGCFMQRLGRVQGVIEKLGPYLEPSIETAVTRRAVPVVWLDGTSGSGKSVLLLQVLEYLVLERGIPVHLLPPSSQRLPEALSFWNRADRPVVIATDDLFAPENREGDVWRRVHELSFDGRWTVPPVILTCGPPEYRHLFEAEVRRSGGLELIPITLGTLDAAERTEYSSWYTKRTTYPVRPIAEENFATAAFLYGLQREGETAGLGQFALRLGDRLTGRGVLNEVLAVMLGTSLGFPLPASLFAGKEDAREALVKERLLRARITEDRLEVLTFLHPSIAGKIFDHLMPPEESHRRAGYLVRCFLAVRGEPARAQAFVKLLPNPRLPKLESRAALENVWALLAQREPPEIEVGLVWAWREAATGLVTPKVIQNALDRVQGWLDSPGLDSLGYALLWQILWDGSQPTPSGNLVWSGREWLQRSIDAGPWNYVWQRLWKAGAQDDEMAEWGEFWLELNFSHPGWGFVFRLLVDSGRRGPTLARIGLLGLRFTPIGVTDPYLWQNVLTLEPDRGIFLREVIGRLCRCTIPRVVSRGGVFVYSLCKSPDCVDLIAKALETATSQELPAVPYVWQALADSFLPALPSRLQRVGRNWLSGREDRAEWSYVWQRLLEISPSSEDAEELRVIGQNWLSDREDRASWAFVWRRLLEIPPSSEDAEELRVIGQNWLSGREDRAEWNYVWQRLLEISSSSEDAEELRVIGQNWLSGREDRAEWTFVWQRLLEISPSSEDAEELRVIGQNWLSGREDRAEWNYVWQRLLEISPSSEDAEELRVIGQNWLSGREDRASWNYVWQRLLEISPPSEDAEELRVIGQNWLSGREDRAEWSFVWRRLLEISPSSEDAEELQVIGQNWLSGREDRAEWNYVWQRLLEISPSSENAEELRIIGQNWLSGREDRASWNYVWQRLLEISPSSEDAEELRVIGQNWLSGREDRASWTHVWEQLLEKAPKKHIEKLYQIGCEWLTGREELIEWGYIWRYLADHKPTDPTLISMGERWLSTKRPGPAARAVRARMVELELLQKRLTQ